MKIGIDLGGSHIAIGVVDADGRIVEKIEKRLTSVEKKNLKESIEEYITEHVNKFVQKYKVTQMGMAIPGWAENNVDDSEKPAEPSQEDIEKIVEFVMKQEDAE